MRDRVFLAAILVSLLAGCGGASASEGSGAAVAPASEVDETPALGQPASVRLLEAGSAPFQPIRYRFSAGATATAQLELHMSMGMRLQDQDVPMPNLPPSRTSLRTNVTAVAPNGDAHLTFNIDSIEVIDGDQYDAQIVNAMQQAYETIRDFSGAMDISPLGVATNVSINIPEGVDDTVRSILDDMQKSLTQLSMLLPTEPVGVGARWVARQTLLVRGIAVEQSINYQLDSRDGDVLVIQSNAAQTAHDATMQLPGLPPSARIVVDALESTGSGQAEVNLTALVPTADSTVHTNIAARIIADGQEQALGLRMELSIHHVPGPI